MTDKTLTLLGFASKAGKLSYGMDMMLEAVKTKKAKLVLAAADLSAKTLKEIDFYTNKHKAECINLDCDMGTLSHAIGRKCGVISVNDNGFAEAIGDTLTK